MSLRRGCKSENENILGVSENFVKNRADFCCGCFRNLSESSQLERTDETVAIHY